MGPKMKKLKAFFLEAKYAFAIIFCAISILLVNFSRPQSNNSSVLFSDSFELGLDSWDLVRYQFLSDGFEYIPPVFDTSTAGHGRTSLKLINHRQDFVQLDTNFITLFPGELNTLSLYLKSDPPGLRINVALIKGLNVRADKTIQLDNNWKRYTLRKFIGKAIKNTRFRISLRFIDKGTIWVDGVQLQKGEPTDLVFVPALRLMVKSERKNNLYFHGEEPKAIISIFNHSSKDQKPVINYIIKDFFQQEIARDQLSLNCKKGERTDTIVNLPFSTTGIFKAYFSLKYEGSDYKKQKEFIYAIIPRRTSTEKKEGSPFGIHLQFLAPDARKNRNLNHERVFASRCSLEDYFSWAESIGAKWLRDYAFISWTYLEPHKGKFHWFDQYLDLAEKHHLNVLGCLRVRRLFTAVPKWAQSNEVGKPYWRIRNDFPLPYPQAWKQYVRAVVSRYKDRIKYWEVWNEPNSEMSAQQYVNLLKIAHSTAKAIDPNCKIVAPASMFERGLRRRFFIQTLKLGAADYCDIFSGHYYLEPKNYPPEKTMPPLQNAIDLYKKWISDPRASKELWNTESGYKVKSYHADLSNQMDEPRGKIARQIISAEEQANYLVRTYIIHIANGLKLFYFHMGRRPIHSYVMQGLIEYDTTPLPAMVAYAVLSSKLEAAKFVKKLDMKNGNECYIFSKEQEKSPGKKQFLIAAWNWKKVSKPARWNISIPPSKLKVYNIMGGEIATESFHNGFLVNISSSPLYFESSMLSIEDIVNAFQSAPSP